MCTLDLDTPDFVSSSESVDMADIPIYGTRVYKEQPNQPFPPDTGLDMAPRDVHRAVQRYIARRPVAGAVLLDRPMCELQLGWPEEQHWCGYRLGLQSVQRVAGDASGKDGRIPCSPRAQRPEQRRRQADVGA